MHLLQAHLNTGINCVFFLNELKVQNQYMLSRAFIRKQTT